MLLFYPKLILLINPSTLHLLCLCFTIFVKADRYYSPDTLLEGWTLRLDGWTLGLEGWTLGLEGWTLAFEG